MVEMMNTKDNLIENTIINPDKIYYDSGEEYLEIFKASDNTLLPDKETKELIKQAQKGSKDAMDLLCMHNYKLVLKNVKPYLNASKYKMDLPDLMQAGFLGIIKAVEKFDLSRDIRFSTYATHWIKQSILRSMQYEAYLIHLPPHLQQNMYSLQKAINDYIDKTGKTPDNKQLLDLITNNKDKYKFEAGWKYTEISVAKLRHHMTYKQLSTLDKPINPLNDNDDSYLVDFVPDDNTPTPEDVILKKDITRTVLKELNNMDNLSNRDKEIFLLYYGLIDNKEYTLQQVADKYNITRERVRQICNKIIKTLRNKSSIQSLIDDYNPDDYLKKDDTLEDIVVDELVTEIDTLQKQNEQLQKELNELKKLNNKKTTNEKKVKLSNDTINVLLFRLNLIDDVDIELNNERQIKQKLKRISCKIFKQSNISERNQNIFLEYFKLTSSDLVRVSTNSLSEKYQLNKESVRRILLKLIKVLNDNPEIKKLKNLL